MYIPYYIITFLQNQFLLDIFPSLSLFGEFMLLSVSLKWSGSHKESCVKVEMMHSLTLMVELSISAAVM